MDERIQVGLSSMTSFGFGGGGGGGVFFAPSNFKVALLIPRQSIHDWGCMKVFCKFLMIHISSYIGFGSNQSSPFGGSSFGASQGVFGQQVRIPETTPIFTQAVVQDINAKECCHIDCLASLAPDPIFICSRELGDSLL